MTALTTLQSSSILDVLLRDFLTLAFPLLLIGIVLGDTIVRLVLRPILTRRHRAALAIELDRLDDRLLADIGLDRTIVTRLNSGFAAAASTAPIASRPETLPHAGNERHPPLAA